MEDDARMADALARENALLKDALNLVSDHEDYKLVESYIIAWGSNDWTNTITINRGENAGIEVGMCAITANGELVGQVTEVGSNFAVVKTILDSSLGISATIASSGYNGMVQGNYISGDEDLLRMNYLPTSAVIRNKDTVVTSGSTSYPRDLVLGYVIDAGFADTGVAKYALLQPAVDIDTLELVFILTEYNAG
jgi:rod shape-determining protein MreC